MLFDTDIIIWIQRGHSQAAKLVDNAKNRFISAQTYMELLQCARNSKEHKLIFDFLKDQNFSVIPFTEKITHRAMVYVEEYSLSSGMRAADALIAATAMEENLVLCTGNQKHFKSVSELNLKIFKP